MTLRPCPCTLRFCPCVASRSRLRSFSRLCRSGVSKGCHKSTTEVSHCPWQLCTLRCCIKVRSLAKRTEEHSVSNPAAVDGKSFDALAGLTSGAFAWMHSPGSICDICHLCSQHSNLQMVTCSLCSRSHSSRQKQPLQVAALAAATLYDSPCCLGRPHTLPATTGLASGHQFGDAVAQGKSRATHTKSPFNAVDWVPCIQDLL